MSDPNWDPYGLWPYASKPICQTIFCLLSDIFAKYCTLCDIFWYHEKDCGVASSNTIFIVNLQMPHSRLDLATFLLIRCAFSKLEEKEKKIIESGMSELFMFC